MRLTHFTAALAVLAAAGPARAQAPVEPFRAIASPDSADFAAFGAWVAAVGDADGDTLRDLVVAAPLASTDDAYQAGRVYLMSSAGTVISRVDSPQPVRDGAFGSAAAFLGDLNGDFRREALVGAYAEGPETGPGGTSTAQGRAYVFAGGSGNLLFTLASPTPVAYGYFGYTVAGPGDLTGDGVGDAVVGAFRETSAFLRGGNVHVYSGATGALVRTLASPTATEDGAFGWNVEPAGDLTGDGVPDLLVAAGQESAGGGLGGGRVHLFSGATGDHVRAFDRPPGDTFLFGRVSSIVGDLDSDGTPDVAVAAPGAAPNGRVFVFSGATGALVRTFTSDTTQPSDGQFGAAIAPAGDVDGDGVPDILVGAPFERGRGPGGTAARAGRVYLLSGATGEVLLLLTSPAPRLNGAFGTSIDWADIDGDGQPDPVVGAPNEDTAGLVAAGRVYVYTSTDLRAAVGGTVAAAPDPSSLSFALAASPNPVRALGAVVLTLATAETVRVAAVDALGREVARLHDGPLAAGVHRLGLDARLLPAGVYVVRATAGVRVATARLVVVR